MSQFRTYRHAFWAAVVVLAGAGPQSVPAVRSSGEPTPKEGEPTKRALLIGVTKYDNLRASCQLSGPGNDVDLLRSTLIKHYDFVRENIVCLTEDEGKPELRPTRANIVREFKRLAEAARAGDQVVVLLAGHGDRQPETIPPDPISPEPDGIDEIFLPADVKSWSGYPERVPNAIADKEIRNFLGAITAKKAYVWAIFDCCHSSSMNRSAEIPRQLPGGVLVPKDEFARARERAAKRTGKAAPEQAEKGQRLAPGKSNEYLVSTFACREYETTPESALPANSANAKYHGLLTYSVVSCLEKSAASGTPMTYRELMQRVQTSYLARPQASPTPTIDGVGQDRVVLGTDKPKRPNITLTRNKSEFIVNVGDLHGITVGSILRVYSPSGEKKKPEVIGHVRIEETRPLDSIVTAVAYGRMEKPTELPATGLCEIAFVRYSRGPLLLGIDSDKMGYDEIKKAVANSLNALPASEAGLFEIVDELNRAHLLIRTGKEGPELQVASGNRPPIPLRPFDSEQFGEVLVTKLKAIHRARSLIAVGADLSDRGRGSSGSDVKIEVIGHRANDDPGRVIERPPTGWVFRTGDRISFRVTNTSKTKLLEVTLLVVDPDYRIDIYYPGKNEINKALEPGASFNTVIGTITNKPPFGPEHMVAIITSPTNPPVDYRLLTQPGVRGARGRGEELNSPVAQLLDRGMNGAGPRSGLTPVELEDQRAEVLNWRTEPSPAK